MSGRNLFFGGVPTTPDVNILIERFEPVPGTSVEYGAVAEVISEPVDSNRFRTVTGAWRKKLFREHGIPTKAEGGAFHFLTADAAQDECAAKLTRVGRATGRLYRASGSIRPEELSTDERRARQLLVLRASKAMLEAAQESQKQLAGPTPKSDTVTRLATVNKKA